MFFGRCDNPTALRDEIGEFLRDDEKFAARYNLVHRSTWAMGSLQGLLDLGPGGQNWARNAQEYCCDEGLARDDLARKVHRDACMRALAFREKDPRLPAIPLEATDPVGGLHLIMQWCIDAGAVGNGADGRSYRDSEPEEDSEPKWSRYMPLTQIAERLLKDGKKWRKCKKLYAKILEQRGGEGSKDWRIRLDAFDKETQKLFDRP
jgi:hypothetical protein